MEEDGDKKRLVKKSTIEGYFSFYTVQTSNIIRNLVLVGFGFSWLFRNALGPAIIFVFVVLTISVLSDFCQYYFYAYRWNKVVVKAEDEGKEGDDLVEVKRDKIKLTKLFFELKIWTGIIGYLVMAYFFITNFDQIIPEVFESY